MVEDHGHTLVVVEVHTRPLAVAAEVHGHPLVVAAEVQEAATADRSLISFNIKTKAWYSTRPLFFRRCGNQLPY
jgi:hypothetical protein